MKKILSPPIVGCIAGLTIGLTPPLRWLLMRPGAPLGPVWAAFTNLVSPVLARRHRLFRSSADSLLFRTSILMAERHTIPTSLCVQSFMVYKAPASVCFSFSCSEFHLTPSFLSCVRILLRFLRLRCAETSIPAGTVVQVGRDTHYDLSTAVLLAFLIHSLC